MDLKNWVSIQFSSVAQSRPTLCNPMNRSMPGLPVHHHSRSSLNIMSFESVMPSSHLILCLPLPRLPAPNPSQRQSLFQWVSSSWVIINGIQMSEQMPKWEAIHYYSFTQFYSLGFCCCITSCPKSKWFNLMSLLSNRNTLWGFDLSSDSLFFMCLLSVVWLYFCVLKSPPWWCVQL